jgi:streptogramin lyase
MNFTPGDAVESWHYVRLNDCVLFAGVTVLGSTSAVTGSFRFAIPVGSQLSVDVAHVGSGYLNQGANYALSQIDVLSGNVRWLTSTAGGTYVGIQSPSASLPWVWASGDTIRGSGMVFVS